MKTHATSLSVDKKPHNSFTLGRVLNFKQNYCNCNCNWGTCIAPPTRRPRACHGVNPYPGVRRQNGREMWRNSYTVNISYHNWTSLLLAVPDISADKINRYSYDAGLSPLYCARRMRLVLAVLNRKLWPLVFTYISE